MILFLATLTFAPSLLVGVISFGLRSVRRVRALGLWAVAVSVASAALLCALGARSAHTAPWVSDTVGWLPLFFGLIGLVALALNPISTGRGTFARILLLNATTSITAFVRDPFFLSGVWALQVALVWLELRSRPTTHPTARICAFYLAPSALSMVAAAALIAAGSQTTAALVLLSFAIGIRSALLPVHSWFPELVEHAPLGIVVAFASPLLGIHHAHWFVGEAPLAAFSSFVPALAVITAVVAGALGVVQIRARRALAYVFISETALAVFGLGMQEHGGATATSSVWFAVGLTTAGFAMVMAALEARRGPLLMNHPTGSYERIPLLATAFLILGLTSVGLPGTVGFVAEDVLFGTAFAEQPWLTMALVASTALNAVTVLRCFFLLFMGHRDHSGERDLVPREWVALSLLLGVLILGGLWPNGGT